MSAEIDGLTRQVAENHKIADLVLLEVKAVFLKHLAKLQSAPQPIPEQMHLAPVRQFKTREVLVPTPGHQPTGNEYVHPAEPAFDNPITAVYELASGTSSYLKFETRDGVTGKHIPEPS